MKLMRATVHSHSEWFKLQMCKDRFESLLKIDSLKEVNLPSLSTSGALLKSNSDSCIHGSSQVAKSSAARTSEDGSSPMQASSIDAGDENAILKVMVSKFNLNNKLLSPTVLSRFVSTGFLQIMFGGKCGFFSIVLLKAFSIYLLCKIFVLGFRSFLLCPGLMPSIFLHSIMEMQRWSSSKYLLKLTCKKL